MNTLSVQTVADRFEAIYAEVARSGRLDTFMTLYEFFSDFYIEYAETFDYADRGELHTVLLGAMLSKPVNELVDNQRIIDLTTWMSSCIAKRLRNYTLNNVIGEPRKPLPYGKLLDYVLVEELPERYRPQQPTDRLYFHAVLVALVERGRIRYTFDEETDSTSFRISLRFL